MKRLAGKMIMEKEMTTKEWMRENIIEAEQLGYINNQKKEELLKKLESFNEELRPIGETLEKANEKQLSK